MTFYFNALVRSRSSELKNNELTQLSQYEWEQTQHWIHYNLFDTYTHILKPNETMLASLDKPPAEHQLS